MSYFIEKKIDMNDIFALDIDRLFIFDTYIVTFGFDEFIVKEFSLKITEIDNNIEEERKKREEEQQKQSMCSVMFRSKQKQ
jgi:hypothetical protein